MVASSSDVCWLVYSRRDNERLGRLVSTHYSEEKQGWFLLVESDGGLSTYQHGAVLVKRMIRREVRGVLVGGGGDDYTG